MQAVTDRDWPQKNRHLLLDTHLQIVFGITVMAIVGVFSIAPALPRIVDDLQITQAQVGWLITIFSLPGIFLMPLMGICSDLFGRQNVVGLSLILFGVAGGACFLVRDFHLLILLRFFQGIGAAPLSSLNIAFISDMYSGNRRDTAVGYNQAILSIGAAVFTAVGGALATIGWFYPFLLPLLGIPIGILVLWKLKMPHQAPVSALSNYFNEAGRTLKNKELVTCYLITVFGLTVVWGSYINYFPILMSVKLHQTPVAIGLIMTVMTLCAALSSSQMGRISKRISGRQIFLISFSLYGLALVLIPLIELRWLLVIPVGIFGIAQGIFIPNIQNFLGRLSSVQNRGMVMALYGSAIRVGQTLGPFIMGLMLTRVGLQGIFFVCAAIAFLLIVFTGFMLAAQSPVNTRSDNRN